MTRIIREILNNQILILSIFSLLLAQGLKILTYLIAFKKLDLTRAFGSGGMPSSHSSFVTTMAISIGLVHGFDSSIFALGAVSSLIIMYDASGVRLAVGKQARLLNELQSLIKVVSSTKLKTEEKFKELVGHTKLEVLAGFILGLVIAVIGFY